MGQNTGLSDQADLPLGIAEVEGFDEQAVETHLETFFNEFDQRLIELLETNPNVTIIAPLDGGAAMEWEFFNRSQILRNPNFSEKINFVAAAKNHKGEYVLNTQGQSTGNLGSIIILDEIADELNACRSICLALHEMYFGNRPNEISNISELQNQVNAELWALYRKDYTELNSFIGNSPISVGNAWIYTVLMDSGLYDNVTAILERMCGTMVTRNSEYYGPIHLEEYQRFLIKHSLYRNGNPAKFPEEHPLYKLLLALSEASTFENKFELIREFENEQLSAIATEIPELAKEL